VIDVTGVFPYTSYTFLLMVCTEAGCTNSSTVQVTTKQDKPSGQTIHVLFQFDNSLVHCLVLTKLAADFLKFFNCVSDLYWSKAKVHTL